MNVFVALFLLLFSAPNLGLAECLKFYGDLMLSRGIEKFVKDQGAEPVRQAISPFLVYDATHIVNLEGSMRSIENYRRDQPLSFSIMPEIFRVLQGFQVVSLENNHALDAGPIGLRATTKKLETMDIVPLAGKKGYSVIVTDNGNIGIVAATDVLNAAGDASYVQMADSPEMLNKIRLLKEISTVVVVYVHWGRELLPIATERMIKLATDYVNAGADLVVGTHPHVVGPVASIKGKPVVYSLGNLLFDQKYSETKSGAVLECQFKENGMLCFELSACKTSNNSFLPHPSSINPFKDETKILSSCTRAVVRTWTGMFTGDRVEKRLILNNNHNEKALWFMQLYDKSTKKLEATTPPMPIRKLQPVDLNGDAINEIMLIQSIYSKFDKETAKRIYIYSFDAGFHALWRGTALSRPLIDAVFVPQKEGGPLLVALHSSDSFLMRDFKCKGRVITVYKWNGFGFSGLREIKTENDSDGISCIFGEVHVTKNGVIQSTILSKQLGETCTISWKQL